MMAHNLENPNLKVQGTLYQLTKIEEGEFLLQEFGKPLQGNGEILLIYAAKTWEEAMMIKHQFLGFEPYKPF